MTIRVKTGAGTQAIGALHVKTPSGLQHTKKVWQRTGVAPGDLSLVFSGSDPLSVTITPTPLDFVSYTSAIVSGELSAVPSGGTTPYTYTWSVVSFDPPFTPTFSSTSVASPTVTKNVVTADIVRNAVLQVVVTDALGLTATKTAPALFVFETLTGP